jgi:hypothetical protein
MYTSLSPPPRATGIHSTGRADLPGSKWPFAGQAYCRPASGARGKGAAPLPGAAALPQYVAKKNFTRISSSIFRSFKTIGMPEAGRPAPAVQGYKRPRDECTCPECGKLLKSSQALKYHTTTPTACKGRASVIARANKRPETTTRKKRKDAGTHNRPGYSRATTRPRADPPRPCTHCGMSIYPRLYDSHVSTCALNPQVAQSASNGGGRSGESREPGGAGGGSGVADDLDVDDDFFGLNNDDDGDDGGDDDTNDDHRDPHNDGGGSGGGGASGGGNGDCSTAYAKSALPWLTGKIEIEQGDWLVELGDVVTKIGMSGEQVDSFLKFIRDYGTATQTYLASKVRGVPSWNTLRAALEKMPDPSTIHEKVVPIEMEALEKVKMAAKTLQLRYVHTLFVTQVATYSPFRFIDPLWLAQDLLMSPSIAQRHSEMSFRPRSEDDSYDSSAQSTSEMTDAEWYDRIM